MRLTKISLLGLVLLCLIGSCVEQSGYSIVPHIDLLDITFKRGDITKSIQDTLIFRLKFSDGDGDLGVTNPDPNSFDFYNPWYYFYNPNNLSILRGTDLKEQVPQGYKLINWAAKRTVPQFDTLPALVCGSWELLRNSQSQVTDTIYIRQNLKAYNVNVDVYAKDNAGTYQPYNFAVGPNYDFSNCAYNLFRATFPDLSNNGQTALDGVITFRIASHFLYEFFNTHTLKMDITVNDRAFHTSNVVEKKDFTIAQISK